jgi:hypothetical protein
MCGVSPNQQGVAAAAASCWCLAGWNAVQGVARGALAGVRLLLLLVIV